MQTPSFVYVKTVFFVSFPKATATAPTKIAIVKMVKIDEIGVSAATKYPTSKGPRTPPILPIPAANPAPVPRTDVGYCSGVYA